MIGILIKALLWGIFIVATGGFGIIAFVIWLFMRKPKMLNRVKVVIKNEGND
jgi:plastocyanin domain-containing protein